MKFLRKILPFIGIFLFIYLISKLSWEQFFIALQNLELYKVLLCALLCLCGIFLKGLRWKSCFLRQYYQYPLFSVFFAAVYYGLVTPGRMGELLKIGFLKDLGFGMKQAVYLTLYDRFFDLFYLVIAACLGISLFYPPSTPVVIIALVGMVVVLAVQRASMAMFLGYMQSPSRFLWQWFLTSLAYFVYAMGLSVLLRVEHFQEFYRSVLAVWTGNFIALIPISFHGLGTREAVYLKFLHWLTPEEIVLASLAHFVLAVCTNLIFCSFFLSRVSALAPQDSSPE